MLLRFYLIRTSIHEAEYEIEADTVDQAREKMQGLIDQEELGVCVFLDVADDLWEERSDKIEITITERITA